jgi:hypothetical protein
MRRRRLVAVVGCLVMALGLGAVAESREAKLPEILDVSVVGRPAVGRRCETRLAYRAPRANVVAVVQVVEDLDGARRATRQVEISVVAAAFGREAGHLTVPLDLETPGRKRVVLTLVTDEREESDPASIEIEVAP